MAKSMVTTGLMTAGMAAAWLVPTPSVAQTEPPPPAAQEEATPQPTYKPPPRGAPGGRVGGASRGTVKATIPLPTIDLLAPDGHTGLTANPTPILYFFVSQPIIWQTQFTISTPAQPRPILEVDIPAPREAGVYSLRTADYHVRLDPGVLYTWSVSVILSPKARSRDIVASASLLRAAPDPAIEAALRTTAPSRRAGLLAQAGLWYDAVGAAADISALDRHAALDMLMNEVGLVEPAKHDRQNATGNRSR
jgi:uncharacterized protein DUF928